MASLLHRNAAPATTTTGHVGPTTTGHVGPTTTTGHHHPDHTMVDTQDRYGNNGLGANHYGPNGTGHHGDVGVGHRRIANPHPLGILAFGSTLFIFSLYSVRVRHINATNAILGQALFVGGLAQLLAGMWAFPRNSTFAATTYTLYGAFWLSLATILIPGTGVRGAYESSNEFFDALGVYFLGWMAVTVILLLGAIRRSIAFVVFLAFVALFFLFIGVGYFRRSNRFFKAGGYFGLVASVISLYVGLAKLWESDHSMPRGLPLGYLGRKNRNGVDGDGVRSGKATR